MTIMTLDSFVRSLRPPQRRFFSDYLARNEADLQTSLAELAAGLGRVSRQQQQLTSDRHVAS